MHHARRNASEVQFTSFYKTDRDSGLQLAAGQLRRLLRVITSASRRRLAEDQGVRGRVLGEMFTELRAHLHVLGYLVPAHA